MSTFLTALLMSLKPVNFIPAALCGIVGLIMGAIPGLSGTMGMMLILPLTFGMNMEIGFSMLLGMYVGGISGSFIAAVLVGIPGSGSSVATCFDGYPMTKKGQASKALAIGITASFFGTFFSTLIAAALSSPIADVALKLGPWELFSLCFCAISMVASLSKGNPVKGMLSAGVGLLAACVGVDPVTASTRFTFGSVNAQSGIDMIGAMLGIFALMQVGLDYAQGSQSMPEVKSTDLRGFGLTLMDYIQNLKTILVSFFIGLWIGFLPGMGSGLSNLVAYAQAKSMSKYPEKFGTGIPDGVFASETANNASIGGALIPMMALGIPGDANTALLLSGLIIHGLQPGPLFIRSNPKFADFVFITVLVSAVFILVLQLFTKRWFPLLLKAPYHYLYSGILIMCYVGGFTAASSMFNVYMMIVFMVIGILFTMADIPSSPMILAFILCKNLESYFRKGYSYTPEGIVPFFTRPVSLIFLLIAVFSFVSPYFNHLIDSMKKKRISASCK
jgi:putative tricarboxylic transport membrane protein